MSQAGLLLVSMEYKILFLQFTLIIDFITTTIDTVKTDLFVSLNYNIWKCF